MGKHEFLTPKAIANRIKAKGLQKLKWYCQMCQKQCRDENGYQCHIRSESHLRQMDLLKESPSTYMHGYSKQFQDDFVKLLSRRWGTKRVHSNLVYQEYIADRHHVHMNGTIWESLTDFVKHLGKEGICQVDDTQKGWFVTWIDNSPKALARQEAIMKKERSEKDEEERTRKLIEDQIERAKKEAADLGLDEKETYTDLKRESEEEKIKLNLSLAKPANSNTTDKNDSVAEDTNVTVPTSNHTSISFNKPSAQKKSLSSLVKKSNPIATHKKEKEKEQPKKLEIRERDHRDYKDNRRDYRDRDRERDRGHKEKDREYREKERDRERYKQYDRESKRVRRD
ncbi:8439_t:CDS:2 [Funneliformis geosporum]|uniref:7675_t:CDS:1 n=1 Tax=Funneliformis geosporum TaxID=1117311 RepID=A0A9W4WSV4_9GLOM|nr:8439_t:CDS:2 [Funneliformis geosporum]CAI2183460.1 7675_t:CDS:2 [Funneliformis geosporum]